MLDERHRNERLEFASAVESWCPNNWRAVVFTDEASFCTRWDQQRRVRRPHNCREARNVVEDCGSLMNSPAPVAVTSAMIGPLQRQRALIGASCGQPFARPYDAPVGSAAPEACWRIWRRLGVASGYDKGSRDNAVSSVPSSRLFDLLLVIFTRVDRLLKEDGIWAYCSKTVQRGRGYVQCRVTRDGGKRIFISERVAVDRRHDGRHDLPGRHAPLLFARNPRAASAGREAQLPERASTAVRSHGPSVPLAGARSTPRPCMILIIYASGTRE
ncbi:hypothetical protein HPB49_004401 [Dermacentor silvarum]|uniref:Uncharacterized protein n=1 Tax=Dermacentor silvarum TaxID=543639 RepID=A0ACB8D2Y7_DERSI|nr:hypothetical protein HPB49_004401 [Dermacentor silvarum]